MNKDQFPGSQNIGNQDNHNDTEIIDECLTVKRMGFEKISLAIYRKVIDKAPEGETFIVPDEGHKILYKNTARMLGRNDLKFVVGK